MNILQRLRLFFREQSDEPIKLSPMLNISFSDPAYGEDKRRLRDDMGALSLCHPSQRLAKRTFVPPRPSALSLAITRVHRDESPADKYLRAVERHVASCNSRANYGVLQLGDIEIRPDAPKYSPENNDD